MASLTENIVNRVRKLQKPINAAQAYQPVLEALSNSIGAIEDRFDDVKKGYVDISITNFGSDDVLIEITDNGIGLDKDHFAAFCEVDTEFKRSKGGKGVGRLFWLDAFRFVEVESCYVGEDGTLVKRAFRFDLSESDQIIDIEPVWAAAHSSVGTQIRFKGLRATAYVKNFPKQIAMVLNHTISEFIADFLSGNSPRIDVSIAKNGEKPQSATYPEDVSSLVISEILKSVSVQIEPFGLFTASAFLCLSQASRGLGFRHGLHFLGNGRTVSSRKIDDLLGLQSFEYAGQSDLRLHVVLESEYLNEHTLESRTGFNIPDDDMSAITKAVVSKIRDGVLKEQFESWDKTRREKFLDFLRDQPIYAFGDADSLFENQIAASDTDPEDFVRALSVVRHRREKQRELGLTELVSKVVSGGEVPLEFDELVQTAAGQIKENERVALAHHAARRKVVLDLLDRLIRRVKEVDEDAPERNHLEATLHSLLVPMRIRGDRPEDQERASHDLWILDERFTYAAGFSSDLSLRKVVKDSASRDRPDILLWNVGFGLAPIETAYGEDDVDDHIPLTRVYIVELKMPGRKSYAAGESIEDQLAKYVREMKRGTIESFGRRAIRVSSDCQFYCFVIADIEPHLQEHELYKWDNLDGGRARRRSLPTLNTVIDVVDWSNALTDARERNRALISMAGLRLKADTAFGAKPTD